PIVIPYFIDPFLGISNRKIRNGMYKIEQHSRVEFKEKNYNGRQFLYITSGDGCFFSPYECKRRQTCRPTVSLGAGCRDHGTILHELLHSIGFQHEHQRPDRNRHIRVFYENIAEDNRDQYRILPANKFVWKVNLFSFDYSSIMMYGPTDFAIDDDYLTMKRRDGGGWRRNRTNLSKTDKEKLESL
ncbi:hypothetical protein JTE90_016155, partial [Oedothorax gibbosus]